MAMQLILVVALVGIIAFNFCRRLRATSRPERRRFVVRELLVIGLIYVGFLALLLVFEKKLVFPASAIGGWDEPGSLDARDVWLKSSDGTDIHAWWCPVDNPDYFVLYSHGNGGNLSHRRDAIRDWQRAAKASVLIYDYPGYGKSGGAPSEPGCVAAAQACYDWLRQEQKVEPDRLILYGKSLGGAVATTLAATNPHRLLVLFAPFTSIPDMAQRSFPIFPARYLVRTQFDNCAKLSRHSGPVIIGHGLADTQIPSAHSERLFACVPPGQGRLILCPGAGHHAPPGDFLNEVARWLKEQQ